MYSKVLFIITIFLMITFSTIFGQDGSELISAIMYQNLEKTKELINKGVNINYQDKTYGSTPLILACQYGFVDIAKFLIEKGADVNLQANNGYTPLIAAAGVSEELTDLLLSKGADINLKLEDGTGALTTSIVGILMDRVTTNVAKNLLDKGADINESSKSGKTEGYTVLMMAARNNKPDLVKFLVKNGADINLMAKDGNTALSLAKKEKDEDMVKLLKKLGAK
jgi:ankyrin repeat protein